MDFEVQAIEAEICLKRPATDLGEGSIWDVRTARLLWLDIPNAKLFRLDPTTGENEEHDLSAYSTHVSSVVPLDANDDPSGDRVGVTLREGFALYNFRTKDLENLGGNPQVAERERFNDGKVDPQGRYWAGTFTKNEALEPVPNGSLYRRDPSGSVDMVLSGVGISNGITWTKDGRTMYYNDTITAQVDAFAFDAETGDISNRRTCIKGFGEANGWPDGCCLDADGMLWVARFNGGCAGRYDPASGKLLAEVRVPEAAGKQVTSVAFGGDGFGDLFLTTAREGKTAAQAAAEGQDLAGSLFFVPRARLAGIGAVPGQPPNALRLN